MIRKFKNRGFNISVLTVLIAVVLQFLFIRYASYSIDKVDYGNFVLLQTLIAGLSAIFLQIPGQAFDRFYNQQKDKVIFVNEFRTMLIGINFLSFFVIVFYSYIYDKFSFEVLVIMFIYFILLNNYALNQKVFLLNMQRGRYFYLKVLEASSKFLFPIIAYFYYQTLESLLVGIITGYIFAYVVLIYFLRNYRYSLVFKWDNLKKYFLFAYPVVFVSIFTWGTSFSDRYFIEYYMTTEDVAVYSLLAMVAGVGSIIGQIYFMYAEPKILKMYEEDSEYTFKMINEYLKRLAMIFSFLLLIALFLPREVYTILLEKDVVYNDYYFKSMMILLVAIFVNILHIAHHMYLKLIKRLDILAYVLFVALVVNLIGNTFIAKYGIMAASISTLMAYITILFLQIIYVSRYRRRKLLI